MFNINVSKLDGKIVEKGYNRTSFSKAIGISRNTLDNYRRCPGKMPYFIMCKMISLLCNSTDDIIEIFFTQ